MIRQETINKIARMIRNHKGPFNYLEIDNIERDFLELVDDNLKDYALHMKQKMSMINTIENLKNENRKLEEAVKKLLGEVGCLEVKLKLNNYDKE